MENKHLNSKTNPRASVLDFKSLLQQEYLKRRGKNEGYSLRAFSRDINLDSSTLSKYFKGTRNLGPKKIKEIAERLNISESQLEKTLHNEGLSEEHAKQMLIEQKHFKRLSSWINVTLLELVHLNDFKPNPKWISKKIGASVPEVQIALNQLLSAGALQIKEDGSWVSHWENITTQKHENVEHPSLAQLQLQLLERAKKSIVENPPDIKSHTACLVPMDKDLIDDLKNEIKLFRKKIAKKVSKSSSTLNSVYCLQLNLFPTTKYLKEISNEKK